MTRRRTLYDDGSFGFFLWKVLSVVAVIVAVGFFIHARLNPAPVDETVPPDNIVIDDPDNVNPDQTIDVDDDPDPDDHQAKPVEPVMHTFYYQHLDDTGKAVYDEILAASKNFQTTIKLKTLAPFSTVGSAVQAFCCDYPLYYWTCHAYTYYLNTNKEVTSLVFEYKGTERTNVEQLEAISDEIVSAMPQGLSDVEKLRYLHDHIVMTVEYYDNSDPVNQEAVSALINQSSVCAGYARAFQLLCQKAGIPCTYVYGNDHQYDGTSGRHAWNFVQLDDKYYWMDVTWDDTLVTEENGVDTPCYYYFLDGEEIFFIQHEYDMPDLTFSYPYLPKCTDTSLEYFVTRNSYFETYNRADVSTVMQNYKNDRVVEIRFANHGELEKAIDDLFTNKNIWTLFEENGISVDTYFWYKFDSISALKILY